MPYETLPAVSGGWLGLFRGARALLVATADDSFVAGAWAAIADDSALQALLDLLTSNGLAQTPEFALLEWQPGADARVIVRGQSTLLVTDATGQTELSGAGVSTWVERTIAAVSAIELTVPGAVAATSGYLPLVEGAVLLAGARVTLQPQSAPLGGSKLAAPVTAAATATPPSATPASTPPAPTESPVDVEATIVVAPESEPEVLEPQEGGYDYLFGETVFRSVAEAAVSAPEEDAAADDEPLAGDHDGETVLTSDIAGLRRARKARPAESVAPPAPKLVLLVSTTGAREPLSEPILVGRSPSVSKVSGGALPRLLALGSIDQDISRNHAQFTLEGDTVVVTDLHSKNGTVIVLPGKEPQTLRAGEPTSVLVGTVVDLGGGITLTVEEDQ
ncbi:hypothetical protein HDC94_002489 [Leifsonia sp. AK011]|uniref:FHA domain-containing protein n=1 Tax=Leifsonia sp. AK011 TaxID=2723075 RepID=UPI0015CC24B2|nr:FHA domain-containing protein [Leifsonia sp. AK011]NYF11333.1 hypothetical protein [Leifsonia sp. AK011]